MIIIMAKDLPYFRFDASEWLEGDITLEKFNIQGFFIYICAWYWKKDCSINMAFIEKRIIKNQKNLSLMLTKLIDNNEIKCNGNNELSINFLDEQYDYLSSKRLGSVESGRRGGLAKAKQSSSYKIRENKIIKDNNNNVVSQFDCFESENFLKTYSKFVQHRVIIKKPLSIMSEEVLLKKLKALSGSDAKKAEQILSDSIIKGYPDIYELKKSNEKKPEPKIKYEPPPEPKSRKEWKEDKESREVGFKKVGEVLEKWDYSKKPTETRREALKRNEKEARK